MSTDKYNCNKNGKRWPNKERKSSESLENYKVEPEDMKGCSIEKLLRHQTEVFREMMQCVFEEFREMTKALIETKIDSLGVQIFDITNKEEKNRKMIKDLEEEVFILKERDRRLEKDIDSLKLELKSLKKKDKRNLVELVIIGEWNISDEEKLKKVLELLRVSDPEKFKLLRSKKWNRGMSIEIECTSTGDMMELLKRRRELRGLSDEKKKIFINEMLQDQEDIEIHKKARWAVKENLIQGVQIRSGKVGIYIENKLEIVNTMEELNLMLEDCRRLNKKVVMPTLHLRSPEQAKIQQVAEKIATKIVINDNEARVVVK